MRRTVAHDRLRRSTAGSRPAPAPRRPAGSPRERGQNALVQPASDRTGRVEYIGDVVARGLAEQVTGRQRIEAEIGGRARRSSRSWRAAFLATRGDSKLTTIRALRDQASEQLEFESAAKLHAQLEKIESVRALAPELVRPLRELHACLLQASANPDEISVFLYEAGAWRGPAPFSVLGMRIQNEQSGSSSLYPQPLAIQPVPEADSSVSIKASRDILEARLETALESLSASRPQPNSTVRQGHLALLTRWYYRPQQKRVGEICFPEGPTQWPLKSMLRSIGRVAASNLSSKGGA